MSRRKNKVFLKRKNDTNGKKEGGGKKGSSGVGEGLHHAMEGGTRYDFL